MEEKSDPTSLPSRIAAAIAWMEGRDLRVANMWLHKRHIEALALNHRDCFDAISSLAVRYSMPERGHYVGVVFGVRVFESEFALEEHIAIQQDDFEGKPVGRSAFMPF